MKHIVAFSGGKDSTAMLLRMIELKKPIDVILFADTGLEYPEMSLESGAKENIRGKLEVFQKFVELIGAQEN